MIDSWLGSKTVIFQLKLKINSILTYVIGILIPRDIFLANIINWFENAIAVESVF